MSLRYGGANLISIRNVQSYQSSWSLKQFALKSSLRPNRRGSCPLCPLVYKDVHVPLQNILLQQSNPPSSSSHYLTLLSRLATINTSASDPSSKQTTTTTMHFTTIFHLASMLLTVSVTAAPEAYLNPSTGNLFLRKRQCQMAECCAAYKCDQNYPDWDPTCCSGNPDCQTC